MLRSGAAVLCMFSGVRETGECSVSEAATGEEMAEGVVVWRSSLAARMVELVGGCVF